MRAFLISVVLVNKTFACFSWLFSDTSEESIQLPVRKDTDEFASGPISNDASFEYRYESAEESEYSTDSSLYEMDITEEKYPLCKYFDTYLMDRLTARYVPAIFFSEDLGECSRRKFKLGEQLGVGSFGSVYRATHLPSRTSVAIKLIPYRLGVQSFMSQIRQEECLQHRMSGFPLVVQHYCTFEMRSKKKGTRFACLVLELVQGNELFESIAAEQIGERSDKPACWANYDQENIRIWTAQMVIMIRELHARSIAFMDLKPENLMVRSNGNLKLVDFGMAGDPSRPSKYSFGLPVGTPQYTAPELLEVRYQIDGHDWHVFSADWYCLGLTLFEIIFKECAFNCDSDDGELPGLISAGVEIPTRAQHKWQDEIDLIRQLTALVPEERLGVGEDSYRILKQHEFFNEFPIDAVLAIYR